MSLSKAQEEEMYRSTLKSEKSIEWIRERLGKGDELLKDCNDRVLGLEKEHSLLKGRLGAFIFGLTFIVSILVNGLLWAWSHISGGKS